MEKFLRVLTDKKMFIVFVMGFASGLPLLLMDSTLKAWCTEAGLDLTTIGLFSLVGLPYTLKFVWSPFLDRFVPPFLGRRRGWTAITQVGLILGLVALSFTNPAENALAVASIAFFITFMASTQDIGIDAYRREVLPITEFAFGNSLAITGYRLAMLLAGAGALFLASVVPWPVVYLLMGVAMGFGLLITLIAPEPVVEHKPPRTLREAFVDPFSEFFSRKGALWFLAFILLYKVGDNMASAMTTPFYLKIGYSKVQIGAVVKLFGIWSTIVGALIGGAAILYFKLRKSLWIFGVLQAISTLGFAWLAWTAPDAATAFGTTALAIVVTLENLTGGMGTSAYTAYMASLTNKRFTATQYALLTSLMGVPRIILAAPTGWVAQNFGWINFFVSCAIVAIPGLLILLKIGRWTDEQEAKDLLEARTAQLDGAKA